MYLKIHYFSFEIFLFSKQKVLTSCFPKECMGVQYLYILLIVVFFGIDDDDDGEENNLFLFYLLGSGFQETFRKKTVF